ncbi:MAG: hypothetical protein IJ230_07690 [Clostridia bacterium]|nr:hypothetical protein [Clostridia bacterium]
MSELINKYPVVLLHGMFGYGQQQITNDLLPYFGLWTIDARKVFRDCGVKAVAPSMGPFTSAWNRACEVYAQLFGGTVDYGKAHAEKYGMNRYGRTYKSALLPEWGTKDENGNLIKINIIGHSFGGVSGRMLTELMVNGSEEERAVTDPDDLSPLFAGGHKGWVHSITTLASPHNGMSSVEGKVGTAMRHICRGICDVMNVLDVTPLRPVYDLTLDMYGLTPDYFDFKNVWKDKEFKDYMFNNKDTIVYDLTIKGAHEANDKLPTHEDIYYFSYRGCRTITDGIGQEWPSLLAFPILNVLGYFMGKQKEPDIPDLSWRKNDMVVNTVSCEAPNGAPRVDAMPGDWPAKYKPGVWHVFPVEMKDHMSYCGWTETKQTYAKFFQTIFYDISGVPTIDS